MKRLLVLPLPLHLTKVKEELIMLSKTGLLVLPVGVAAKLDTFDNAVVFVNNMLQTTQERLQQTCQEYKKQTQEMAALVNNMTVNNTATSLDSVNVIHTLLGSFISKDSNDLNVRLPSPVALSVVREVFVLINQSWSSKDQPCGIANRAKLNACVEQPEEKQDDLNWCFQRVFDLVQQVGQILFGIAEDTKSTVSMWNSNNDRQQAQCRVKSRNHEAIPAGTAGNKVREEM